MSDLDPAHVTLLGDVMAKALVPEVQLDPFDHYATAILTSTDPDVHAALLAALVRAGVLDAQVGFSVSPLRTRRRYATRWEDVDA